MAFCLGCYPCEEETCRRSLPCPSFSTVSRQSSNHGQSSLLALHSQQEHRSWSSSWILASTHAMDLSTGSGGITHPNSNLALCHCMDCGPHQSPGQQHRTRTSPSLQVAALVTYINMAPGNSIANRHQNLGLLLLLNVATRNFQVTQMTPISSLHNMSVGLALHMLRIIYFKVLLASLGCYNEISGLKKQHVFLTVLKAGKSKTK